VPRPGRHAAGARATIEKFATGGRIKSVEVVTTGGKTSDEATVVKDGKTSDIVVAADGAVSKSLPRAVLNAENS
jgi:hypothetical protein